jgi:nicotinate-nucleotide adenylyltransferase
LTARETHRYNAIVRDGETMRKIGLMGGTFDPIHHGHLFIAEEARVRCGLEKVIFFPNNKPAHKEGKTAHADPETRFALTRLAVEQNPQFQISRIEIDRPGPSYAIETVAEFQKQMPDAELFYIVGADSIGEVLTWYQGAKLFELCRFIAFSRPDFDLQQGKAQLSETQQARVTFLETVALDIASRDLRKRVQEGLPIRYLVPDIVEQEIRARGLYQ